MTSEAPVEDRRTLEIVSEQALALADGSLRPYQVVVLRLPSGEKKAEYSRYMSADGRRWVRHGLFQAFHSDGRLASQGRYTHGAEEGQWQDFHGNGQLAARGQYRAGREVGIWQYWSPAGQIEESDDFGSPG